MIASGKGGPSPAKAAGDQKGGGKSAGKDGDGKGSTAGDKNLSQTAKASK